MAQAAGRYAREEIESSPDRGAELERKPDRQIAEWGAEPEAVDRTSTGSVREAGLQQYRESPEQPAESDKTNEPVEMDMDM